EVWQSLRRRDQLFEHSREAKPAHAYLLWLRSVLDAELESRSVPRAVTTYNRLLEDWRGVITTIASRTGLVWPRQPEIAAVEIDNFLSARLRHHVVEHDELDLRPEMTAWVKETYNVLLEFARRGEDKNLRTKLDNFRAMLEEGSRAFSPVVL